MFIQFAYIIFHDPLLIYFKEPREDIIWLSAVWNEYIIFNYYDLGMRGLMYVTHRNTPYIQGISMMPLDVPITIMLVRGTRPSQASYGLFASLVVRLHLITLSTTRFCEKVCCVYERNWLSKKCPLPQGMRYNPNYGLRHFYHETFSHTVIINLVAHNSPFSVCALQCVGRWILTTDKEYTWVK